MPDNPLSRGSNTFISEGGGSTGIERTSGRNILARGDNPIFRRTGRGRNDTVVPNITLQVDSSGQVNPGAANAMANDPARNQLLTASLDSLIPILYGGPERLAGKLYIPKLYGNVLYLSIILCQGEIEQIGTAAGDSSNGIFLNDVDLAGSTTHLFKKYVGTAGQGIDPWLAAAITTPVAYNESLANTAYIVCQMAHGSAGFPRLVFTVKGRKIFDPRQNLLPDSNNFGSWTTSGTLTTAQTGTGPWGATNYAWVINDTSGATVSNKFKTVTVANNGASYVLRVKIRKTTGGTSKTAGVNFSLTGGTAVLGSIRINCDTGAFSGSAGCTVTSTGQAADGYWWVSIPITNNSSGNTNLNAVLLPATANFGSFVDAVGVTGSNTYAEADARLSTMPAGYIETGASAITQPTQWTDNAGLILGDFLASSVYGEGRTVNAASLASAAEYCDEMLGLAGSPNEKRSRLTILIDHRQNVRAWRDVIRQYIPAWVAINNNEAIIRIDRDEPMDHTFTSLNARQNPLVEINRTGSKETPNALIIGYTDTTVTPYKMATVESNTGESPRRPTRIDMPGLRSASAAKRMSILRLNHYTLEDLNGTFPLFDEGLKVLDGDLAQITDEIGITNQKTRILTVSDEGHGRWGIYFRKHDPAVYSNLVIASPTTPTLSPPDPNNPPAVAGLALFEDRRFESGIWVSRIKAVWNNPAETYPYVQHFVVQLFDSPVNAIYAYSQPFRWLITSAAHGLSANDGIYLDFTTGSGTDKDSFVIPVDAGSFEAFDAKVVVTSGNVTWRKLREHQVTPNNQWISQPVVLGTNYAVRVRIWSTTNVMGP